MGTTMQRFASLCALLAIVVMAYAVTEVQELGNDDSSSALEADHAEDAEYNNAKDDEYDTQMERADDDDEDELGEGQPRRGGAFLSTTGSFTLSSGGGTGVNDIPEEDEEED